MRVGYITYQTRTPLTRWRGGWGSVTSFGFAEPAGVPKICAPVSKSALSTPMPNLERESQTCLLSITQFPQHTPRSCRACDNRVARR